MKNKRRIVYSYQAHESLSSPNCFYCDHFGDTIDHCPPVSLVSLYPHHQKILVRACAKCNYTLGAKFLPTLLSRVKFLIKRYRVKYRKYLNMPSWDDEEVAELKGSLKIFIENERQKCETAHNRIEFIMSREKELEGLLCQ